MCQLDFGERADVWRNESRRARKEYVCDCCGGLIRRGTEYVRHFSVFAGGSVTSERACSSCVAMTQEFLEIHGAVGNPGSMRPLLDECIETETAEGHTAMAAKWRAELRKMDARRETALKGAER